MTLLLGGVLWFLANITRTKVMARDKHTSLFYLRIIDEEKGLNDRKLVT